jgi:hypothetical protein
MTTLRDHCNSWPSPTTRVILKFETWPLVPHNLHDGMVNQGLVLFFAAFSVFSASTVHFSMDQGWSFGQNRRLFRKLTQLRVTFSPATGNMAWVLQMEET